VAAYLFELYNIHLILVFNALRVRVIYVHYYRATNTAT